MWPIAFSKERATMSSIMVTHLWCDLDAGVTLLYKADICASSSWRLDWLGTGGGVRLEARLWRGIVASALLAGPSPLEVFSCCGKGASVPRHVGCEEAQTSSSQETRLRALMTLWIA